MMEMYVLQFKKTFLISMKIIIGHSINLILSFSTAPSVVTWAARWTTLSSTNNVSCTWTGYACTNAKKSNNHNPIQYYTILCYPTLNNIFFSSLPSS